MASQAMPPVSAPSPITATTCERDPDCRIASASPSAALMDVVACPVLKASQGLSSRFGNPLKPPSWRKLAKRSRRPVSILCAYVWCPTSHTIWSCSASNSRCKANVSSTTPRFEAKCPPFFATTEIISSRISCAKISSSLAVSSRKSRG